MQVTINAGPKFSKIDNLFVLLAEGDRSLDRVALPDPVARQVSAAIQNAGFSGRMDESITVLADGAPKKITLLGLGKSDKITHRLARAAFHSVAKVAKKNRDNSIAVTFPYQLPELDDAGTTQLVADLLMHADYRYETYLTVRENDQPLDIDCVYLPPPTIDAKHARRLLSRADAVANAVRTVRDLGNGPGNEVTPARLAERAAEICKDLGLRCTIWDRKQIEKMKMGGLLAVNRGSGQEPRFVIMEYAPKNASRTVCLVGKGITFDSGGISIKPADRMEEMKFDMCGAAAVIGTLQAAATLQLPVRLIGVFAATENLPGGNAYKPGDIIRMMSGKTVEVVNTDAEGRVILADALHYASTRKPDCIIDYATLTGACVVALGNEASGLFTSDSDLAQKLIESGERVGERLWRLPEWDDYKDLIRSEWADVKNSGGRWGGAITAALFLKEFVDCPSWAHVDIAGTAWTENSTSRDRKGATGVGVRMTIDFLESLS